LGNQVTVLNHCVVTDTVIGDRCSVGPFAHLRPESVLGESARVGNFVELKKTSLGAGAKANHLAYLGDAVIGENSNIGAGTITCNYDGVRKHPTTIGRGAFVGSNSTLVAPVTIGDGSYVAAGSAITEDVPADALGIGRSRQENKPGWAAKRRAAKPSKPKS
jgi:bifunctional UDP-N-acetylglucosamine pyrophosphorylase/glucosamine-1-phosphate N-acetyltransferase